MTTTILAIVALAMLFCSFYGVYKLHYLTLRKAETSSKPEQIEQELDSENVYHAPFAEQSLLKDCLAVIKESYDIDEMILKGEDVTAKSAIHLHKRDGLLDRVGRCSDQSQQRQFY
ncbi:hypothetical protein N473_01500 [Pseudoalteromonas luteoviolacea CPMOR-1]|uniref:Uncharacterized protein n=1 Tax=Pseudoalteromonas luteoviolacea CPMOR-1 TaxID=1365248 RepID=A0A167LV16_9GAMM|nr:hypothetical protein [Pseudoalteromonas luteoviolacea]KZN65272.1 hypothetical protein N473_01500 [Pseudoalteromonas luteoviolacea CPMOR-1]